MILFVDDERFFVNGYVEALMDAGFEVEFQKSVVEAMRFFKEHESEITLVITDVMMPPRGAFDADEGPDSDLETGFAVYDWFRKRAPDLPIVVLTNNKAPHVDRKFQGEKNCWLYRKGPPWSPFKLAQQIKSIVTPAEG